MFTEHGKTEVESWARWEGIVLSLASKLGLTLDRACLDPVGSGFRSPSRRCAVQIACLPGTLLRFEDIPLPAQSHHQRQSVPKQPAMLCRRRQDWLGDDQWRFSPKAGLDSKAFTAATVTCFGTRRHSARTCAGPDHLRRREQVTALCAFEERPFRSGDMSDKRASSRSTPARIPAWRTPPSVRTRIARGRKKWTYLAKWFADGVLPESVIARARNSWRKSWRKKARRWMVWRASKLGALWQSTRQSDSRDPKLYRQLQCGNQRLPPIDVVCSRNSPH